jgi:hypothetical protein
MRVILFSAALLVATTSAHAQVEDNAAGQNPFAIVQRALQRRQQMSLGELASFVDKRIATAEPQSANSLLMTAELLRQAGDYRAEKYYDQAIEADPAEPAYELFYADYLRNFRGPLRPLLAEAGRHYFAAIEKLRHWPDGPSPSWAPAVRDRAERGLVALYQEDGIPLAWQEATPDLLAPLLFFSPTLRGATSTSDLDEVHDARDFTAEAQFAASAARLNRPLTTDELRGLVRRKEPEETRNRLRLRLADSSIDLIYAKRRIENAQVTNFFVPDHFNRVELSEIGISAAQVLAVPPFFDAVLKAGVQRFDRRGLIEFLPRVLERVDQVQGEVTLSRFLGPDRADLVLAYVSQDISPDLPQPPRRDRRIASGRLVYEILRPLASMKNPYGNLFATRGWQLYGGAVDDREHFGVVEVKKRDLLLGTSLRGIGRFDLTLQPTLFTVDVSDDRSQRVSQLRAEGNILFRIVDEEAEPGIPQASFLGLRPAFLHLVAAYKHDSAREGLRAFENDRLGLALETSLFVRGFADLASPGTQRFRGTTFVATFGLANEHFPRLKKDSRIVEVSVSAGF